MGWSDLPARTLFGVWALLSRKDRSAFACVSQRWSCFSALVAAEPVRDPQLFLLAFDRFHIPPIPNLARGVAFQMLRHLLELPPFPNIVASESIRASAHERINQGMVRLITVIELAGGKRLLVRQNAGMSKSKLHDTWVALAPARPTFLPLPVCDCVNWYVMACCWSCGTDAGPASAARETNYWCVHMAVVALTLQRLYIGWQRVV